MRPADYESIDFGASVEWDTEVDEEIKGLNDKEIGEYADEVLETLLAIPVDRALRLGGTMEDSHLWEFYEKD